MSQPPTSTTPSADAAARIAAGYAVSGPAIELGAVVHGGTPHADAGVRVPLAMLNRHGLIAGATGTGKTRTLQLIAEQLSAAGVPVVLADVKGDLTGLASPGAAAKVSDFPELSDRERQVLGLLAKNLSNAAIAERLGLSGKTVANYVSTVLTRLGVPDRGAAAALVAERAAHGRGRPRHRAEQ